MKTNIMKSIVKSIVISDLHIPFENKKVVDLVLHFIKEQKPDRVFIDGDLLDCSSISRFPVRPDNYVSLATEIKLGKEFLKKLKEASPGSKIVYIFGNHEYRLSKYITMEAREFFGLISLQGLLETDKMDIEVVDSGQNESFCKYGDLLIGHFDRALKTGTGKSLLDDKGISLLQSHTHRISFYIKRIIDGTFLMAHEIGCLCDLSPSYTLSTDWVNGFCVINIEDEKCNVQVIPIIDNKFYFGDKKYEI
jgi:predicted MPP superfamily phosphohydrolase